MSTWDKYIDQILHKCDFDTNEWEAKNVCSHAAIYGLDETGSCWAYSENMPELKSYTKIVETMEGEKDVHVNELMLVVKAGQGKKDFGDSGLLIGGVKFRPKPGTYNEEECAVEITAGMNKMEGAIAVT